MRKKRFTAFLLSLAMAGTSLYTCGVIDVQAAAVAEDEAEDQNLEQLVDLQEQAAAIEEEGAEAPASEEVVEPEQQAAAVGIKLTGVTNGEAEWYEEVTAKLEGETGEETLGEITFKIGDKEVGYNESFTADKTDVGSTVTVEIRPENGGEPVAQTSYVIAKRTITSDMMSFAATGNKTLALSYNGEVQRPELIISDNQTGISLNMGEFIPGYTPSADVGQKEATAEVQNNQAYYRGSATIPFTVEKRTIASVNIVNETPSYNYTGAEIVPAVTVKADGILMDASRDYEIKWTENKYVTDTPKAEVILKSDGYFVSGNGATADGFNKTGVFDIISKNDATFAVSFSENKTSFEYGVSLSDIESQLVVSDGQIAVSDGDYAVSLTKGTVKDGKLELGDHELTVSGCGNYGPKSKGTVAFTIGGVKVSEGQITADISPNEVTYNGKAQEPKVTSVSVDLISENGDPLSTETLSSDDYIVTYENAIDVASDGDAAAPTVVIALKGKFAGTKRVSYNILPVSIGEIGVSYNVAGDLTYNGGAQKPALNVSVNLDGQRKTLVENTDYIITGTDSNISANAYSCTISGCGNYKGQETVSYNIKPVDISSNSVRYVAGKELKDTYHYTSKEIDPEFQLEYRGYKGPTGRPTAADRVLSLNRDYTVSYNGGNHTDMGTVAMTISGQGNYTGTLAETFEIIGAGITKVEIDPISYNGSVVSVADLKKNVKVYSDSAEVSQNMYTIDLGGQNPKDVGSYEITIKGTNFYDGDTATGTLNIVPRSISANGVSWNSTPVGYYYKGGKTDLSRYDEPVVSVSDSLNVEGISTSDYAFKFDRKNVNSGEYTLTGLGNYTGTVSGSFTVEPINFEDSDIVVSYNDKAYVYSGEKIKIDVSDFTIYDNKHQIALSLNEDCYITDRPEAINAGTVYMEITAAPTADYVGKAQVAITVEPKDISEEDVVKLVEDYTAPSVNYVKEGGTFTPSANLLTDTLSYCGMHLSSNDYDVCIRNDKGEVISTNKYTDAGVYDIVAVGKGNYKGERKLGTLEVNPIELPSGFELFEDEFEYTGSAHMPAVIPAAGLIQGQDFDVKYPDDSAERGKHFVEVIGKGNYTGTVELMFVVEPLTISEGNTEAYYAGKDASGNVLVQVAVDGKGLAEEDYEVVSVTAKEGTDPQEWDVVIAGKGAYEGTVTKTVKEGLITILKENVSVTADFTYTGEKQGPKAEDVVVTVAGKVLSLNTDYTVTVPDGAVDAGDYPITVTGMGDYTGTVEGTYTIKPIAFTQDNVTVESSVEYTGSIVEPVKVVVDGKELVLGKDYTVTADDMINVGEKTLTIEGIGNYAGSVATGTCTITAAALKGANVDVTPVTYTGSAQKAVVASVVKNRYVLVEGKDYTVTPVSRTTAGKSTVTVTGKGNYTGTATGTFTVNARDLSKGKITGIKDRTYTGKAVKQTTSLKIVVNGRTLKNGTDYTVSYKNNKKIGQASFTIKGKGNYRGETSTRTFKIYPKKATIKTLKAGSKRFTVTTKKQGGDVKYQVHYRVKGSKNYSRVSSSKLTQVVKGLKKGKTYNVRVRTYKKVGGKTYYGAFSKAKNVKIK